jgi:hypothetical protein
LLFLKLDVSGCNFVWNFCNDTQLQALKWNKRWPSGFDLNRLTAGSSPDLALHAGTINAVSSNTPSPAGREIARACAGGAGARWAGCR